MVLTVLIKCYDDRQANFAKTYCADYYLQLMTPAKNCIFIMCIKYILIRFILYPQSFARFFSGVNGYFKSRGRIKQ